jgi:hypothetical protein
MSNAGTFPYALAIKQYLSIFGVCATISDGISTLYIWTEAPLYRLSVYLKITLNEKVFAKLFLYRVILQCQIT